MGCLYGLLTELFGLLIVNDGPVVFLVIAFAGSLCCSVIWRLFALLSNDGGLSVSSVKQKRLRTPKTKAVNGVVSKFERSSDEFFCLKGDLPVRRHVEVSCSSLHLHLTSKLQYYLVLVLFICDDACLNFFFEI